MEPSGCAGLGEAKGAHSAAQHASSAQDVGDENLCTNGSGTEVTGGEVGGSIDALDACISDTVQRELLAVEDVLGLLPEQQTLRSYKSLLVKHMESTSFKVRPCCACYVCRARSVSLMPDMYRHAVLGRAASAVVLGMALGDCGCVRFACMCVLRAVLATASSNRRRNRLPTGSAVEPGNRQRSR